ncbi:MAG: folate-binding protein [Hyphomicrobiaceae bacterium]
MQPADQSGRSTGLPQLARLEDRAILSVGGPDARHFLNNLLTSDIAGLRLLRPAAGSTGSTLEGPPAAAFAGLLAPQGKILFEMLVAVVAEDRFVLDVAEAAGSELLKRLSFYKLRSRVVIEPEPGLAAAAVWGGPVRMAAALAGFADPRLATLGTRLIGSPDALDAALREGTYERASLEDYHAHRIGHGVPELGQDFLAGEIFPHEALLDQMGGVDFRKGCYVGQEVVSRMQHRGTARSRFVPVVARQAGTALPGRGKPVTAGTVQLGAMGSSAGDRGLALIRLDRLAEALAAGVAAETDGVVLKVGRPDFVRFEVPGHAAGGAAA